MICYASHTGTKRNLAALRTAGWRLLLSPRKVKTEGFRYALDNGAWSAFQQNQTIDLAAYERALERFGGAADWVVAPDIVAGGMASLALTAEWLPRLRHLRLVLIAVQDGMTPKDVAPFVGPGIGIFLGGSTEWKLGTMQRWGDWAHAMRIYFHVGRVNTAIRIRHALRAGADSIDGTSATRYAITLPLLDHARKQPTLFAANGVPTEVLTCRSQTSSNAVPISETTTAVTGAKCGGAIAQRADADTAAVPWPASQRATSVEHGLRVAND